MYRRFIFLWIFLLPLLLRAQTKTEAKHVILIGIDGLGANYLKKIDQLPNLEKLKKEGSYTYHARCIRPSSSAANWAAMTMGAGPALTGYTQWNSKTPEIPSRVTGKHGIFPTIFEILHDQKPEFEIGVIYTWDGIGYLFPKEAVSYDENTNDDNLTEEKAISYIKEKKPELLFLHFDDVDGAGHGIGWGTDAYISAVQKMDRRIGNLIQATKEAGIYESTIFIVTADHGGFEQGHGGDHIEEMEIPWLIMGPGVQKGIVLEDSIITFDTAATIAHIFDLETPQVWIGRPVQEAFHKREL